MTTRQNFLRLIYPFWMFFNKLAGKKSKVYKNVGNIQPHQSFYDLSVTLNNGDELPFDSLKGQKILIVNTASDCGYTNQYDDLQKLYDQLHGRLMIIGFPANDFREQEKGDDKEIAEFCKINFGVTFPLARKGSVIKGNKQQQVFQWLTDKTKNGWNNKQPSWNFTKYLINEQGTLVNYFDPAVAPISEEIIRAIDNK